MGCKVIFLLFFLVTKFSISAKATFVFVGTPNP
jgi:hypothetical protein